VKGDLTSREYWEPRFSRSKTAPDSRSSIEDAEMVPLLRRVLEGRSTILEVGCGGSYWLPFFSKELGMEVSGIDFSRAQCEAAEALARFRGASVRIACCDFRDPPTGWRGTFDAVFSAGVVEHFSRPQNALGTLGTYLKPGGILITTVPNLVGLWGKLQGVISPSVLRVHNLFDLETLVHWHEEAGLEVMEARYTRWLDPSILNTRRKSPAQILTALAYNLARRLRGLVCPGGAYLSAGQFVVATCRS
jgi:SAM-dependent methyltransferase